MATIGKVTKQADGSYKGSIATLTINKNITLRPVADHKPGQPVYRVFAGYGEIGAAFEAASQNTGETYLSLKLDDPSFAAPIYGAMFPSKEKPYTDLDLVWSRPKSE